MIAGSAIGIDSDTNTTGVAGLLGEMNSQCDADDNGNVKADDGYASGAKVAGNGNVEGHNGDRDGAVIPMIAEK